MHKMKTVILGFTIKNGSVSDYFMQIVNEFKDNGYRVIVITDGRNEKLVNMTSNPMILTWPSRRPTHLKDAIFFYKLLKEYRPEILIGNFASANIMTVLGFLFKIPKRIAWIHTLSTQIGKSSVFSKVRKKIMYSMTTNIITNSNAMKEDVIAEYNVKPTKVDVFFNAVKLEKTTPLVRDMNTIVYVGRLHFSKGVDILIEAFSVVASKNPNVKLKIIGTGEEEKNLKALVKRLKIDKRVDFVGSVGKDQVLSSFASANFAIVPSRNEAFGLVVIEAMSTHTPVIGAATGGIAEIIRDGDDGVLFYNNDSNELSEKITMMLENPDIVEAMRNKAYDRVVTSFNAQKIAKEFVTYIKQGEIV